MVSIKWDPAGGRRLRSGAFLYIPIRMRPAKGEPRHCDFLQEPIARQPPEPIAPEEIAELLARDANLNVPRGAPRLGER